MGIFSFLKKKEAKPAIPEAPELVFPEISVTKTEKEAISEVPEELPEISEEISLPELPEIPEVPGVIPDIEEIAEEKLPELPELKVLKVPETKGRRPLFINVDDYKELMEQLNNAKSVLSSYSGFSARLNELKISKEEHYEKLRNILEEIERKLLYIDKVMFEGG